MLIVEHLLSIDVRVFSTVIMHPRRSYTVKEKLKIVRFAETEGNRQAARHFTINECNIRLWRRTKSTLERMYKFKRSNRGRCAAYPKLEEILLEWVIGRRRGGIGVSCTEIRIEALKLKKKEELQISTTFKASYGWGRRFMERNGLSICRRTTISQRLPADYEEKLLNFQKYVIRVRKTFNYPLS